MAIKSYRQQTRVQDVEKNNGKNKENRKQQTKNKLKDQKALIIAQEIKFSRLLACNDNKIRDKVLKNLKKWLIVRSKSSFEFTEADFMRLWKGLFYCMWMSDKPLIQEELAENLSKIVHCFDSMSDVLLYTKCTLKTLSTEWFGIDQYRLDKFSMLVRRIFRQTFQVCKNKSWNENWVKKLMEILEELLLDPKAGLGFNMHVIELYWEEVSKVSEGDIPEEVVTNLIKPFVVYMATLGDEKLIRHIMKHIFRYLIFQSDIGIDYKEKFEAWRQAGFPCGTIEVMEKIERSDDEISEVDVIDQNTEVKFQKKREKPLDPRAGRVDVELPQIQFHAKQIAELLKQYKFHSSSTAKSRRQIGHLIKEFTELSEGKMPLGLKEIKVVDAKPEETDPTEAAMRLLELENELYSDSSKNNRKRKKYGEIDEDGDFLGDLIEDEIDEETLLEKMRENLNKKRRTNNLNTSSLKLRKDLNSINATFEGNKRNESNEHYQACDSKTASFKKNKKSLFNKFPSEKMKNTKLLKVKHILNNEKTVAKNATESKLTKIRKYICGQWDVSDNVEVPTVSTLSCDSEVKKNEENVTVTLNTKLNDDLLSTLENEVLNTKQIALLTPVLTKLDAVSKKSLKHSTSQNKMMDEPKKRVKIMLQRNTAHHTSDYIQQVRQSPAIPFDANRKPLVGVLKANSIPSPVNPFYKRHVK